MVQTTQEADVVKIHRAALDVLERIGIEVFPCEAICNTTKHVTGNAFLVEAVRDVVDVVEMVAEGRDALRERPFISFTSCWTVSPLHYATETVDVLTEILLRQEVPVFISSAPQAWATSPAALAGTLVQIHAEEMSGLTYCNLVRPGAPVVLGYVPSVSKRDTFLKHISPPPLARQSIKPFENGLSS